MRDMAAEQPIAIGTGFATQPGPRGTTALASPAPAIRDGWTVVRAPSLGTFYRSPKPGNPPYCEAGQIIGSE